MLNWQERRIMSSVISREQPLSDKEQSLFDQLYPAFEEIQLKENGMDSFPYPKEDINKHKGQLRRAKQEAKKNPNNDMRGKLLEAIFLTRFCAIDQKGTIGVIPASEFDDWIGHTDFVLEIQDKKGELQRVAIDVTTAIDQDKIKSKMDYNFDNLNEVKYFEKNGKKETLKIHRMVVGISPKLLKIFCEHIKAATDEKLDKNERAYYIVMIKQIWSQLEARKENLRTKSKSTAARKAGYMIRAKGVENIEDSPEMKALNNLQNIFENLIIENDYKLNDERIEQITNEDPTCINIEEFKK